MKLINNKNSVETAQVIENPFITSPISHKIVSGVRKVATNSVVKYLWIAGSVAAGLYSVAHFAINRRDDAKDVALAQKLKQTEQSYKQKGYVSFNVSKADMSMPVNSNNEIISLESKEEKVTSLKDAENRITALYNENYPFQSSPFDTLIFVGSLAAVLVAGAGLRMSAEGLDEYLENKQGYNYRKWEKKHSRDETYSL